VTAADLCFDAVAHFPPYLYSVPSAITPHQPLLRALGVRDTFTQSDYVAVLRRLYTDAAGEPLTAQQLALALQLLDHVVDLLPEGTYSPPHSTAFEVTDLAGGELGEDADRCGGVTHRCRVWCSGAPVCAGQQWCAPFPSTLRGWKVATSKADPRQQQDLILKCLQGGQAYPLAVCEVATLQLRNLDPNSLTSHVVQV
jgi:hypothetical protein